MSRTKTITVGAGGSLVVLGTLLPLNGSTAEPAFAHRELYAPAHFGNSYEVMGEREMRAMLEEARHWGFNSYGDWYDTVDCADPFADPHYNMGKAMWERKKINFQSAQDVGLQCTLLITPNHVYLDQCRPDLLATKGGRIFGQLICPSKPEARATILKNYENLLADLAAAGVKLSALGAGPYDFGGCACEQCNPWILTFGRLCKDIHTIAQKHHPGIAMHMIGWWWDPEEHAQFAAWADEDAPGWVKSISLHIPYGTTDVSDVPLPKDCQRWAFVHNGYADQAQPRDIYGHLGPVIAPKRLPATIESLKAHGVIGFMAYSEGVYEDANKALLAGISSGQFQTADAVLRAYAGRYYGASGDKASAWATWLTQWGRPFDNDAEEAGNALKRLAAGLPADDWRWRHWALKAEMLRLNAAILTEETWTPQRLGNAEAFWAVRERLERQIYGLGPLRHIFDRRFAALPWHKSWADHMSRQTAVLADEM